MAGDEDEEEPVEVKETPWRVDISAPLDPVDSIAMPLTEFPLAPNTRPARTVSLPAGKAADNVPKRTPEVDHDDEMAS
jgi:hypothetical protein